MGKTHKISLSILVFAILFISSCKNSDPTLSKTDLLTSSPWKYSEYTSAYDGSNTTWRRGDQNSSLSSLESVIITFTKNGSRVSKSGSSTLSEGTWKFLNNESKIEYTSSSDGSGLKDTVNVTYLSSKELNIGRTSVFLGKTSTMSAKLVH